MKSVLAAVRFFIVAIALVAMPRVAMATPMPLDGSWIVLDEFMDVGDFFTGGPWEWNSSLSVRFDITDLYVVTDRFEVYDNNILVLTTPDLPNWDDLGVGDPFDMPPYEIDPDAAWASAAFSSGSILFGAGMHSITIRDISIPPVDVDGDPFGDGTVAFRAEVVPEPTSLLLLGSGLTMLAARRRRKSR